MRKLNRFGIGANKISLAIAMNSAEFEQLILHDEWRSAVENAPMSEATRQRIEVCQRAMVNQRGGASALLFLALVTAGGWIIWDLVRSSPNLFAEAMIDGHFMPANPNLYRRIESDSWFRQISGVTALHFLILPVIVILLAAECSYFQDMRNYHLAMRRQTAQAAAPMSYPERSADASPVAEQ